MWGIENFQKLMREGIVTMEFELLGQKIEIKILADYKEMANRAEKAFQKDYEDSFALTFFSSSYAEKAMNKYSDSMLDGQAKTYVYETRKYLTKFGEYTLTDEKIWEEITRDYDGISRLRYRFEEFLVDNVSEDTTDRDIVPKMKAKFESGYFSRALRNDIMALCDFVNEYLDANKLAPIEFIYEKEVSQAEAIYKNLLESNIPASERERLAKSLIELDPRCKSYYEYIFYKLPQAKYEIAAIAKYLSIDLSDMIEKDLNTRFDSKNVVSEEQAKQLIDTLAEAMEKYQVKHCAAKTTLELKLREFDIEARTYDGVLYASRELRAQAEKADMEIKKLYGDENTTTKERCKECLAEIAGMTCASEIKEKHRRLLDERILQIDRDNLEALLGDLGQKNKEECEVVRKKIDAYDAPVSTKKAFWARIDNRVDQINREHFEALLCNLGQKNKEECKAVRKEIDDYDAPVETKGAFLTRVDNRIDEIDKEQLESLLCDLGKKSEGECESIREQVKCYAASENIKKPFLSRVEDRICEIWEAEDFERFTEMFINTRISNVSQIEENKKIVRETARIQYVRDRFIVAFAHLNPADVESAAKYAAAQESGMIASLLNHGKKDVYDYLSLGGKVAHPDVLEAKESIKAKKAAGFLSSFGFGRNKAHQQSEDAQNVGGAKFCSACGTKVDGISKFCSSCGTKL